MMKRQRQALWSSWQYPHSDKSLGKIFDKYSSGPDEYRFDKTVVPVKLAIYEGERLVSRSQAKRILNRVERFERVVLDFEGRDSIGQRLREERAANMGAPAGNKGRAMPKQKEQPKPESALAAAFANLKR